METGAMPGLAAALVPPVVAGAVTAPRLEMALLAATVPGGMVRPVAMEISVAARSAWFRFRRFR